MYTTIGKIFSIITRILLVNILRAVSLESNKNLKLTEINIPEIKPDECLIKIKVCGVCSSDIYRAFDKGAYFYPLIMGHEISGKIVEIGEEVKGFKNGDKVSIFPLLPCFKCNSCKRKNYSTCINYKYYGSRNSGGFAEFMAVKNWNLIKINEISFENGAFLEPLSVVVHGLKKSSLINEESKFNKPKICIIGAGFLGLLMSEIIFNKLKNSEIHIIDKNQFKLDFTTSSNRIKTHCLDKKEEWEKFINIEKNSFDFIFELSGNETNFVRSINLSNANGKILWLGNIQTDLSINKNIVSSILRKELNIIGSWNSRFKHKDDDWQDSIDLIKNGYVNPSKYITKSISLDELPIVLEKMYFHKIRFKKHHYLKYCIVN